MEFGLVSSIRCGSQNRSFSAKSQARVLDWFNTAYMRLFLSGFNIRQFESQLQIEK